MDHEHRLKRLRFRAWHRGTREADLMIGGYFDASHSAWNAGELDWFEALLEEQDVDIMGWAIGSIPCPPALGRRDDGGDARARFRADHPVTPAPRPRAGHDRFPMPELKTILSADTPLTLSGVPSGFLPVLLADMARAAPARAVFVATDEATMRAIAASADYFAPELEVVQFPAWDCLPYDRASPTLRTMAERIGTLQRLQKKPQRAQLVLTTVAAATQRTLTPFRIRQLVATLKPGERIDRDRLAALLQANGYVRTDTVHDQGEYAVRGGIVDLFPSGEEQALRLDFFGDEIESVRTFDPADQRTTGRIDGFVLLPASEVLLDEASIKRFRAGYVAKFGATATGDPLYQAISEGRRLAGMEHWLPLFEESLATLWDHLRDDAVVLRDAGTPAAAESRLESIADYFENRRRVEAAQPGSYRPLAPRALYLDRGEWDAAVAETPVHLVTPFHEPDSTRVVDFEVDGPRDFAPERAGGANVYEAVVAHVEKLRKQGRTTVLASYSGGARERLKALLEDHGLTGARHADTWQEALGVGASGVALAVVALDHGFTAPHVAVLTEQDMLGDRLVRRAKRRKSADAFLAELATLSPGDLVVHSDHGIGRYIGLTQIPVARAPHDCVALEYAGGDKLYVPVENLEVLSRYGNSDDAASLDRLGGEAWQRRKSRMKERIREIAGDLIAVAAERALRPGEIAEPDQAGYPSFVDRFPYTETDDQDRAIEDVLGDLSAGKPMDRLIVGDVGYGKTEVALRAAFVAAMAGMQVAVVLPDDAARPPAFPEFHDPVRGLSAQDRAPLAARPRRRGEGDEGGGGGRRHRHRRGHPRAPGAIDRLQATGPRHRR